MGQGSKCFFPQNYFPISRFLRQKIEKYLRSQKSITTTIPYLNIFFVLYYRTPNRKVEVKYPFGTFLEKVIT